MLYPPHPTKVEYCSELTIERLVNQIRKKKERLKRPLLIGIAGGSCVGKTTQISEQLKKALGDEVVHVIQDNFQLDSDKLGQLHPLYFKDDPANYGIADSKKLLLKLKKNEAVNMPVFNFREAKRIDEQTIEPKPVVLFDGLYALHKDLLKTLDVGIYIEMPLFGRLIRRIIRNTLERYQAKNPSDIFKRYLEHVIHAHHDLVVKQRVDAHLILRNRFLFSESVEWFNLSPLETSPRGRVIIDYHLDGQTHFLFRQTRFEQYRITIEHNKRIYFDFPISLKHFSRLQQYRLESY